MANSKNQLVQALAQNEMQARHAAQQEKVLEEALNEELQRVNERLQGISAGVVLSNDAKAFEYQRLLMERAQLLRQGAGGELKGAGTYAGAGFGVRL